MASSTLTLGYWDIRGLAEPIRTLLAYLDLPYENKKVTTYDQWKSEKESAEYNFPNLPYLVDGEKTITEAEAIEAYVCLKANRPDLIGKEQDRVEFLQLRGVIVDFNNGITNVCYQCKTSETLKAAADATMKAYGRKLDDLNSFTAAHPIYRTGPKKRIFFQVNIFFQWSAWDLTSNLFGFFLSQRPRLSLNLIDSLTSKIILIAVRSINGTTLVFQQTKKCNSIFAKIFRGFFKCHRERVHKILEKREWLMGYLTYLDFKLAELIERFSQLDAEVGSEITTKHAALLTHSKRILELPGVKEYRASDKFQARPHNGNSSGWK